MRPSFFRNVTRCRMVDCLSTFRDMSVPYQRVRQSVNNTENRWLREYIGGSLGSDTFSGKVWEPIRLLSHKRFRRTYGGGGGNKKSRREGRRQSKSGKNERGRGVTGPTAGERGDAGGMKNGFSQIVLRRAGQCSDTDPSLNSGGARFEHRFQTADSPRGFEIFLGPANETPVKSSNYATTSFFQTTVNTHQSSC